MSRTTVKRMQEIELRGCDFCDKEKESAYYECSICERDMCRKCRNEDRDTGRYVCPQCLSLPEYARYEEFRKYYPLQLEGLNTMWRAAAKALAAGNPIDTTPPHDEVPLNS